MNKANFPKIDKLLKYHEQKINEEKKLRLNVRNSVQGNRRSIESLDVHGHEKTVDPRRPPLNRKELLQQDLKRIQQGRHEVNGIRKYY